MVVYVYDSSSGMVKIVKRGNNWYTYKLKVVEAHPIRGLYDKYKYKFVFEKKSFAQHGFKPYEKDDVSTSPDVYLSSIKRFQQHKVRKMI